MKNNNTVFILTLIFVFVFFSGARFAVANLAPEKKDNDLELTDTEKNQAQKIKYKIDPFRPENNFGYNNYYLKLYKSGKISAPPPFGGPINSIFNCPGNATFARWSAVGPPRPGTYIWDSAATRTYPYGPPYRNGQYLLGLYAPKYFCVMSINPLVVLEGLLITMMGSST